MILRIINTHHTHGNNTTQQFNQLSVHWEWVHSISLDPPWIRHCQLGTVVFSPGTRLCAGVVCA